MPRGIPSATPGKNYLPEENVSPKRLTGRFPPTFISIETSFDVIA